jgi:hypothetical protein
MAIPGAGAASACATDANTAKLCAAASQEQAILISINVSISGFLLRALALRDSLLYCFERDAKQLANLVLF